MDGRDYEVGYGKPPRHTQFKKGQSGNPKGRRKGMRNLKTDLAEELAETVTVRDGDRRCSMTKQRALVKSLMARALGGDIRATVALVGLIERALGLEGALGTREEGLSREEVEILTLLNSRMAVGQEARTAASPGAGVAGRAEEER